MRVTRLRPADDSEVILPEAWVAKDGVGHISINMTGPLVKRQTERSYWTVDLANGTYHAIRLTANDVAGATFASAGCARTYFCTRASNASPSFWPVAGSQPLADLPSRYPLSCQQVKSDGEPILQYYNFGRVHQTLRPDRASYGDWHRGSHLVD